MINGQNFILDEIPAYHPLSQDYVRFWREQKRRIIEGAWLGGYYIPPSLYFYVNFSTIELNKNKYTNQKVFARPWLRELEWDLFRGWTVAQGFSGFADDPEYTSHKEVLDPDIDLELLRQFLPFLFKPDNTLKKYMDPLEYLKSRHPKHYTKPVYTNQVKNFMMMGARDSGKSYIAGPGIVLHQFLTDNHKLYGQSEDVTRVDITVGAEGSEKSKLLLDKVRKALTHLPGAREIGDRYYPSPISKKIKGSWNVGSEVIAEYQKKVGGEWKSAGSGSKIKHRTFRDDSFKDQGARPSIIVLEEIGLFSNLKDVYYNTKNNLTDGDRKIGSLLMLGCVTAGTKVWTKEGELKNIEDITKEDGLIGYDGEKAATQEINHINPPAIKSTYRITTTGGNNIECSDDHPFIYSNRKKRIGNRLKFSYREAKNLQAGDYILTLDSLPIFGPQFLPDSYLLGLMLGDGYFKGRSVSIDDPAIYEFVVNNYPTSIRKSFTTKTGQKYYDLYIKSSELFKRWGIFTTKEAKRLPADIHTYDKRSLAELIAGVFDSDGNVYYHKSKNIRVVLTNISKDLLEDVKYALLKFGIHSNLYKEKRNTTPQEAYKGQKPFIYRLYISKDKDIERFITEIPLKHSLKRETLLLYKKGNRNFRTGYADFVHTGEHEDEQYIPHNLSLKGYRYERIKSVEYTGENPVYNLNVGNNHTYIASTFITGNTGGDMDKGTVDAAEMFYNPEGYDILAYDDIWEHRGKIGYFIYAPMVLNAYLDEFGKVDYEKALKAIHKEREKAKKVSSDKLNKEMQYKPLKPSEMFLARTSNIFPAPELRRRLSEVQTLDSHAPSYLTVDLFFSPSTSSGVDYALSDKQPILNFPIKDDQSKEGAVVIYELPKTIDEAVPKDLYIIGVDPYKDDGTDGSLAAVYVLKTSRYPTLGYNEIVASFIGRPFMGKNEVNEIVHKLSLFYNAKIYFENAVGNVKDYFEKVKRLDLLATQPVTVFNKKASYSTNQPLIYGYPMSNQHIKWESLQYLRSWLLEERGEDNDSIIRNLDLLPDTGLIQELISFNMDGNFDRVMGMVGCIIGLEETKNLSKRKIERQQAMSEVDVEFDRIFVNNRNIFNGTIT